jgi:SAM-dependent methyltransferase
MVLALEETRSALAAEWRRAAPSSDGAVAQFYAESEYLADDLEAWHATPERQAWTQAIVRVARANKVASVLDVGAGAGHDLRALRAEMPDAQLYGVEPNHELRRRLSGFCAGIEALDLVPIQADLVLCIDVLEHVPDPDALLAQIIERVKVGGLLVEASATHDQSTPLHLPSLDGWEATDGLMAAGFRPVEQINRLVVWQRQHPVSPATVLVVAHREVTVPTVQCLLGLYDHGWPIAFAQGDALVDRARSKALAAWYRENDTDVFLMVDDDIVFSVEDAARVVDLARTKRTIACGAYPVGDGGHMASRGWPGQELHWGPNHQPVEIRWPATGYMAVHRDVVGALVKTMDECYAGNVDAFWPVFQPFALDGMYLSEDYAFGERARQLGFATWMEPRAILSHLKVQPVNVLTMRGVTVEGR